MISSTVIAMLALVAGAGAQVRHGLRPRPMFELLALTLIFFTSGGARGPLQPVPAHFRGDLNAP